MRRLSSVGPVSTMLTVSVASLLAVLAVVDRSTRLDVVVGLVGPLAATTITWVLVERTHRRDPERLTGVMVSAFAGKIVFFGAYVAVMLRVVAVRPVPFVASFTGYFIALYLIEALYLRRLLADGAHGSHRPQADRGNT